MVRRGFVLAEVEEKVREHYLPFDPAWVRFRGVVPVAVLAVEVDLVGQVWEAS